MNRSWLAPLVLCLISHPASAHWIPQESGTTARLRGLSGVSPKVAWACGTGGTCLRTLDGGTTWRARPVPGASGLDFRDVHAVDADTAYLLSIGAGEQSRIYKTADGGATWELQHTNKDPNGFLDALAFWDAEHGLALGDPVGGRFVILTTDDGGKDWRPIPPEGMPPALPGEGAFAASGTCLVVQGSGHAWFATGGAKTTRVFRSTDRGRTWTAHETPVWAGTPSSGLFSLAFRNAENGVAVGGDYKRPEEAGGYVARTSDGGRTWTLAEGRQPAGYRSAVAHMPGASMPIFVAVGPTGTDISSDGGEDWKSFGETGFDAVGFAAPDAGWAVGEGGRIARYRGQVPGRR
jgi:photosystem II stability/assembly factor-like uncharacterized protein